MKQKKNEQKEQKLIQKVMRGQPPYIRFKIWRKVKS